MAEYQFYTDSGRLFTRYDDPGLLDEMDYDYPEVSDLARDDWQAVGFEHYDGFGHQAYYIRFNITVITDMSPFCDSDSASD